MTHGKLRTSLRFSAASSRRCPVYYVQKVAWLQRRPALRRQAFQFQRFASFSTRFVLRRSLVCVRSICRSNLLTYIRCVALAGHDPLCICLVLRQAGTRVDGF